MGQSWHWFLDRFACWFPTWLDPVGERMGLRVLAGRSPRLWFAGRRIVLVAKDVDAGAGVAAVWLAKRPRWRTPVGYVCVYEYDGGGWHGTGGLEGPGSPGWVAGTRPRSILEHEGSSSARSYIDRVRRSSADHSFAEVGWVACALFTTAADVAYLEVGDRRITVPAHGHAVVVWKAPPALSPSPSTPHAATAGRSLLMSASTPGTPVRAVALFPVF